MFGSILLYKGKNLFTKKGMFIILLGNMAELIVYLSATSAILAIILKKSDITFVVSALIFACSALIWKILLHAASESNGKIKKGFYK